MRRSPIFQRIILVLSALVVLGIVVWVSQSVFEPVPVPYVPPAKAHVTFNPRSDIRNNALFSSLIGIVTGEIEPGMLGRPNPFVGPPGTSGALSGGQGSRFGSVEMVSLGGGSANAVSAMPDGSMLVFMGGNAGDKSNFELRDFHADGTVDTFSAWSAALDDAFEARTIEVDPAGTVWAGSANGRLGTISRGAAPSWLPETFTPGLGWVQMIRSDGAGRIWATDRHKIFMGDGQGMNEVVLLDQLTTEQKEELKVEMGALPADVIPVVGDVRVNGLGTPLTGDDLVRAALDDVVLYPLPDGRMGVLTRYTAFVFPFATGQRSTWVNTITAGSVPVVMSPSGSVWSLRLQDRAVTLLGGTTTQILTDPYTYPQWTFAPGPGLIWLPRMNVAAERSGAVAVEYSSTSTQLWIGSDQGWLAQNVMASGTLPEGPADTVALDRQGDVWLTALTTVNEGGKAVIHGNLVHIKRPRSTPSPY